MNKYSKQYHPKPYQNMNSSQKNKEKRTFLMIVSCLMVVLVISGVVALAKTSKKNKLNKANAANAQVTVGETVSVSDEESTDETYPVDLPEGLVVVDAAQTRETKDKVNVRKGPGTEYEVLGEFERGELVTVTGICQGIGWVRVDYKGKAAFCSEKYLKAGDVTEIPTESTTATETTTAKPEQTTQTSNLGFPDNINKNSPYYIRVNRTQNIVTVYGKDEQGNFTKPVKAMVCSVGTDGKTPTGTWNTTDKYVWRALSGGVYGQYATRITGHYLFHSVPYFTQSKSDLEYNEYNKLGQAASLGCVRLSVADVKWIYDNCPKGTTVTIYDSSAPEPLPKPTPIRIDTSDSRKGWDPTDPDPNNPW